jgi:toxin FitB
MTYLLDTCVISELASTKPNQSVVAWIDDLNDEDIYLSVITLGEIRRGIDRLPISSKRKTLEKWLQSILVRFQSNIISVDTSIILHWGSLVAELDKNGTPMPAIDSLIAASASFHRLTLVTRNVADFKNSKIPLFNPWKSK